MTSAVRPLSNSLLALVVLLVCIRISSVSCTTIIEWQPCQPPNVPSFLSSECANYSVPLTWNGTINMPGQQEESDSLTITNAVTRIFCEHTDPSATQSALLLLQGGPGMGASGYLTVDWVVVQLLNETNCDTTLYLPDHRGTGNSTYLYCQDNGQPNESWEECLQTINAQLGSPDALLSFSTTQAAYDIAFLVGEIQSSAMNSVDVHVYGASYGTHWAARYAQIEPEQASSIILDSITPPDFNVWLHGDANSNAVTMELFRWCGLMPDCSAPFTQVEIGLTPMQALSNTQPMLLGEGKDMADACQNILPYGTDSARRFAYLLYQFLSAPPRKILPMIVLWLHRCTSSDASKLSKLLNEAQSPPEWFHGPPIGINSMFSYPILYHISINEWMILPGTPSSPPGASNGNLTIPALSYNDCQLMEAESNTSLSGPAFGAVFCYPYVSTWLPSVPSSSSYLYAPSDPYIGTYPLSFTGSVLLLDGDLDSATNLAWAQHFHSRMLIQSSEANRIELVRVNNASHVTIWNSLLTHETNRTCSLRMLASWIRTNATQLNQTCLQEMKPLSFYVV